MTQGEDDRVIIRVVIDAVDVSPFPAEAKQSWMVVIPWLPDFGTPPVGDKLNLDTRPQEFL
jgi:hypothetical protein